MNTFALGWRNPTQAYAPITTARFELCPAANGPSTSTGCVTGQRSGGEIHSITDLAVPGPGAWRARLWLADAAGNEDRRTALESVLRFDSELPTIVFREQASADPARLRVAAVDATSGVSRVEIEARRRGDAAWTQLPTEAEQGGYTAFMDDELLAAGVYDLRARAVDAAGNERTTASRNNGQPAVLELPVRREATLRVGQAARHCRKSGRHSRCRSRLASAPQIEFGRRAKLSGWLRIDGSPLSAAVEVWRQVKIAGAPWERVARVQASRTGDVHFVVPPGPARLYRFRYPGSPTIKGATALFDARVRASSTFAPSRRDVVNGEYVTFRGRLKGGMIPVRGKLVELQVFTRRRWRTFAQPRASATTGRWAFQYRFEAVSGRARFRFRARIRRETGYPFHIGTSREVAVTVHGL